MATMDKEAREAILKNALVRKIKEAKGEICRFDCSIGGTIILGRWMDEKPFFWVENDKFGDTYEVKGKRFFNVSGDVVRSPFFGAPDRGVSSVGGAKSEVVEPEEKKGENDMQKAQAAPSKPAKVEPSKPMKTVVIKKGGDMNVQLDYKGNKEEVPAAVYVNKIKCKCGNVRYVKNSDVFQVKLCKPCVMVGRMKNIARLRKIKTANNAKVAPAKKKTPKAKK